MVRKLALCALLLTLMLTLAVTTPVRAAELDDAEAAAQALSDLGLFRGTEQGFALNESCDRVQAAVIFTRLLGAEAEALEIVKPHPFRDIGNDGHWAAPYLGYLYSNSYARGITHDQYGTGQMEPQQFATFMLRALGYVEGESQDFTVDGALDKLVELEVISGTLRNRLRLAARFTRGDAVLMAQATLYGRMKDSELTLLEHLNSRGVINVAVSLGDEIFVAYPTGMFTDARLSAAVAGSGYQGVGTEYALDVESIDMLYWKFREQFTRTYDLMIVPAELGQRLYFETMLETVDLRKLPSKAEFESIFIGGYGNDNDFWYDYREDQYFSVPFAFEVLCLYYEDSKYSSPGWNELYNERNDGKLYLPLNPTYTAPLAFHYMNLGYSTSTDREFRRVIDVLAEQWQRTPAYLGEDLMLRLPERKDAQLGVISSRYLPQLAALQAENETYAKWTIQVPPNGTSIQVYYAIIPATADQEKAYLMLNALLEPETAAQTANHSGYLPTVRNSYDHLEGLVRSAYLRGSQWDTSRVINPDWGLELSYEQTMRNALLKVAEDSTLPYVEVVEVYYEQNGLISEAHQIDLKALTYSTFMPEEPQRNAEFSKVMNFTDTHGRQFRNGVKQVGLPHWKTIEDGPQRWRLEITYVDGTTSSCRGGEYPLTWPDVAMLALDLTGHDVFMMRY